MDRLYEWGGVLPEMQLDPGVMTSLDDPGMGVCGLEFSGPP